MEYIYAAMLLHSAEKEINEESVTKILEAAGESVEPTKVKALVAALDGINIDEAIEKAAVAPVAAGAPAGGAEEAAEEKEEEKEEQKEEEAAAGLGALFG